ncbi:MAG: Crp/Fnr family transcriptional regulator [Flavobacteriales bacterium]|nr:Crp/Fnr family transcriptional regulator [Flavobacteriales bacterium]
MPEDIISDIGCVVRNGFNSLDIQNGFSKEEWKAFMYEKEEVNFKKGEIIIKENSVPKGVFCIKTGKAKLYRNGFNGKEQILRFLQEGDLIGYRSILCGETFSASATALEDMEITYIPERFFIKLLELSPTLAFDILKKISHDLGEAGKTITLLAQKTVRERLAEILILLEEKLGVDKFGFINIELTREEIANLVGTATESAIRLISEFKNDELIEVDKRKIKILNQEKLLKSANIK